MIRYSRLTPPDVLDRVELHVRSHISSVATPDDNPDTLAADVAITTTEQDDGQILVTGEIDADPVADYLRDGWTPEQDIARNPLSVPSILDES